MDETRPGKPVPLESPSRQRSHNRLRKRLVLAAFIGVNGGYGVGAFGGAIWFEGTEALLISALAGGILGIAVGMLSGYAR